MKTDPKPWIDSERKCICCAVTVGYPEPDCEVHGMDAHYGRYDSYWWGRIRMSPLAGATVVAR